MVRALALGVLVLSIGACGRSGFVFGSGPEVAGSDSASDSDRPSPDDPVPDPDGPSDVPTGPAPVEPDGCGDGVITRGELCFDEQVVFAARIDPCSIDIGDLDNDGHLDVAVPNSDFDHLESSTNFASVLYGDGVGRLSPPSAAPAGTDIPVGLAIADVDADGVDDLVVANNEAGELNTLMGLGNRVFAAPAAVTVGDQPIVLSSADLDGDGLHDVGAALQSASAVAIARSAGGGVFAPPQLVTVAGDPWGVAFGDLDGNGTIDLAATDVSGASISLRFGRGDGTFFDSDASVPAGFGAMDVKIVDIDLDGDPDIISANHDDGTVSISRGQSGGTFISENPIAVAFGPRALAISDFDLDGDLDVAVVHDIDEIVWFLVSDPTGALVPAPREVPVGTLPSGLRAGDFNEDGIDDLAISNQLDNEVGLILSNP